MADRRERMRSLSLLLRSVFQGLEADLWTSMPGILQSYDPTEVTCSVLPAIQSQQRLPTGKTKWITLPVLIHCPVLFQSGGGYYSSLPLEQGDEGWIHFSARCIDSWWQSGGVQTQAELRMHDISDGAFYPGGFSQPRVPTNLSATAARTSSTDGLSYFELDRSTKRMNVVAPNGLWVGPTTAGLQKVTVP